MTVPRMRAGNSDRQAAVDKLTLHFTEGRLDAGEFDERVGTAYAATHLDELPALLADLPEDQPRPGYGSGARWPDPDRSGPFAPAGRPGPFAPAGRPGPFAPAGLRGPSTGSHRPQFHRPPRILAVLAVLALLFSIGALTHGVFPFPLIWIAFALLLMARAGRRRRWADSPYRRR